MVASVTSRPFLSFSSGNSFRTGFGEMPAASMIVSAAIVRPSGRFTCSGSMERTAVFINTSTPRFRRSSAA
jgi:hypothetical protein